MNRTLIEVSNLSPSTLEGTLAITGFAAEVNLRDVAQALVQKDLAVLARSSNRNAKLARLRIEVDEQVALESAKVTVGVREKKRLNLASEIASIYEKFGAHTVPIAQLCSQLVAHKNMTHVSEIKKFLDHIVLIADKAAMAFIDEDLSWAQVAAEQGLAATDLYHQIKAELAVLGQTSRELTANVIILNQIMDEAEQILELVGNMTNHVIAFLEAVEI